jgi:hypothetical protein
VGPDRPVKLIELIRAKLEGRAPEKNVLDKCADISYFGPMLGSNLNRR